MNLMYNKKTKLVSISVTSNIEYIFLRSHLEFIVLASFKCTLLLIIFSILRHKVILQFINTMREIESKIISIGFGHFK